MERKNDNTIFLLIAAGLGIYWLMKNKATQPATTVPVIAPAVSTNNDIVSTQPVYENVDVISTQPVYETVVEYSPITDMVNSFTAGGTHVEDKYL